MPDGARTWTDSLVKGTAPLGTAVITNRCDFSCRAQSFGRSDAAFERGVVSEDQYQHRREKREKCNGQQTGAEPTGSIL